MSCQTDQVANQVVPNHFYKSSYLCALTLSLNFKLQHSKLTNCTICDFQLMMVYLSTCALVFWITATQSGESLACKEVRFLKSEQKYLANHVMETKQAKSELICGYYCAKNKSCTSINYKTSGDGKGRCELNNKTSHVDDKVHDQEFNHLAVIERVSTIKHAQSWLLAWCEVRPMHDIKDLFKKFIDIDLQVFTNVS